MTGTLAGALCLVLAGPAATQTAGPAPDSTLPGTRVLVVSRGLVLAESKAAKALSRAEAALTTELQSRIDEVKARLSAEEQELTRLRDSLPQDEFERRVQAFDQEVRSERRLSQRRAAALQTAVRQARGRLVEALVPILVSISRENGASLVLDRDQILVAHPSIDVTEQVLERFDEQVTAPELPSLAELEPQPEEPPAPPGAQEALPGVPGAPPTPGTPGTPAPGQ